MVKENRKIYNEIDVIIYKFGKAYKISFLSV